MRNKFYYLTFFCLPMIVACASIKHKPHETPLSNKKICVTEDYGFGFDSIYLYKSTARDVIKILGKTKIERVWRPNNYPIVLGEVIQIMKYPDLGVTLYLDHGNGRFSKKTVRDIIIDSTSLIKTQMRNGIGSTYREIINEFGAAKLSTGSFPTYEMTDVYYDLTNKYNRTSIIRFIEYKSVDTSSFKVKEIWLTYQ